MDNFWIMNKLNVSGYLYLHVEHISSFHRQIYPYVVKSLDNDFIIDKFVMIV